MTCICFRSPLFVTLNKQTRSGSELRGCIGNLGPLPLSKLYEYALNRFLKGDFIWDYEMLYFVTLNPVLSEILDLIHWKGRKCLLWPYLCPCLWITKNVKIHLVLLMSSSSSLSFTSSLSFLSWRLGSWYTRHPHWLYRERSTLFRHVLARSSTRARLGSRNDRHLFGAEGWV